MAGLARTPSAPPADALTILEASAITRIPTRTLHRRVTAWENGRRDEYAIEGGRGRGGTRWVDRAAAEATAATRRGAGPGEVPADRRIGVREAHLRTGLAERTIHRRVDAWINGGRSDYAIRGGWAGTHRFVDSDDAAALVAGATDRHASWPATMAAEPAA